MKYDKYGDPIIESLAEADKKTKNAFLIMILVQILLIVLNIVILLVPTLNFYLSFITAPIFIFLYITFIKGYSNKKDDVILPGYCKAAKILCPICYVLTMVLAVFSGV